MDRRDVLKGAAAAAAGFLLPLGSADAAPEATRARLGVRPGGERGRKDYGWLDARYTFSFASYSDPRWMGFRSLRVINEDRIQPGKGFPTHPHQDMEILTYILSGALEHKDTLGNGGVIRPGAIQQMSAGRGIRHSEFNPSRAEPVHLLQIWIQPDTRGVEPKYAEARIPSGARADTFHLLASKDGRDDSIRIHQDANVHAGILGHRTKLTWRNPAGRHVWIQLAGGRLKVNDRELGPGDGAWTSDAGDLAFESLDKAEVLLFDLA